MVVKVVPFLKLNSLFVAISNYSGTSIPQILVQCAEQ